MDKDQVDMLIEIFLLIIQKQPSPVATRGFLLFYRFLANKDRSANNSDVAKRFPYSRNSVARLSIGNFFGDYTSAYQGFTPL